MYLLWSSGSSQILANGSFDTEKAYYKSLSENLIPSYLSSSQHKLGLGDGLPALKAAGEGWLGCCESRVLH